MTKWGGQQPIGRVGDQDRSAFELLLVRDVFIETTSFTIRREVFVPVETSVALARFDQKPSSTMQRDALLGHGIESIVDSPRPGDENTPGQDNMRLTKFPVL